VSQRKGTMKPQLNTNFGFHVILMVLWPFLGAAQGTVTVGRTTTKDSHPFGIRSTNVYTGEFQQIYASTAFANIMTIHGVAFISGSPQLETADYDLTVSLGTTSRTPAAPGTTYISSLTPVFSGDASQVFTAAHDFDLVLNFTVPFTYNPADGNLLLDVVMVSARGSTTSYFDAQDGSLVMGTLWSDGTSVVGTGNYGLVTEFAIPEPSTFALLDLGGLLLSTRLFRKARASAASLVQRMPYSALFSPPR
jgi:hypothetical protein